MRKVLLSALFSLFLNGINAGVYRHDVDPKKYKDLAAQPQFECAGYIVGDSRLGASCVLIGDRYVLCAAHCFIKWDPAKPDTFYENGTTTILARADNPRVGDVKESAFRFKQEVRYGKNMVIYPMYLDSIQFGKVGNCDLVVIELNEPITDIKPARLNTAFNELHCIATGVGWGASGKANEAENVAIWFEEIAGQNMIDSIGGYKLKGQPTSLLADFDSPDSSCHCNKYGSPAPLPLEYMTSGGDSGGGLFRQTNDGTWELIGICTGGGIDFKQFIKTGYYGQLGAWTRVSVFHDWISKTIKDMEKNRDK
jgi:hypothetical protein